MSDSRISPNVLKMIDDETLRSVIYDEWRSRSKRLLEKLEEELCKKYSLIELGWWGSDGIGHIERGVSYYRPELIAQEKKRSYSWDRERGVYFQ